MIILCATYTRAFKRNVFRHHTNDSRFNTYMFPGSHHARYCSQCGRHTATTMEYTVVLLHN